MVELISLKDLTHDEKLILLKELGYDSDGIHIIDKEGKKIQDPYINEIVTVSNMLILPGSTIILDNNPLSITKYMEDHPDVL